MLVLSRKSGQRIVIGDEIVITILKVRGNHVRVGIEAPPAVPIRRDELENFALSAEDAYCTPRR
jgi:carbon storage regulator